MGFDAVAGWRLLSFDKEYNKITLPQNSLSFKGEKQNLENDGILINKNKAPAASAVLCRKREDGKGLYSLR